MDWKINIVKLTIFPKAIYRFNAISTKIPVAFFTKLEKNKFKIYMETQFQTPSTVLRKKNKAGSTGSIDFKLYHKATDIKTVWHWHKNRSIEQRNRRRDPEINPHFVFF